MCDDIMAKILSAVLLSFHNFVDLSSKCDTCVLCRINYSKDSGHRRLKHYLLSVNKWFLHRKEIQKMLSTQLPWEPLHFCCCQIPSQNKLSSVKIHIVVIKNDMRMWVLILNDTESNLFLLYDQFDKFLLHDYVPSKDMIVCRYVHSNKFSVHWQYLLLLTLPHHNRQEKKNTLDICFKSRS